MITIIYHRSDYDGTLSLDAALAWLHHTGHPHPVKPIGWDYGDPTPEIPVTGVVYMLDISIPALLVPSMSARVIWIDHHRTAIQRHGDAWKGKRIEGVAACRLTYQWFQSLHRNERFPSAECFRDRTVDEPLLIRLAGEYDIWDKRDPRADTLQYGLRAAPYFDAYVHLLNWITSEQNHPLCTREMADLLDRGVVAQAYAEQLNNNIAKRCHEVQWQDRTWLVLNHARGSSASFGDQVAPHHDGLLMWRWAGGDKCSVSLYGVPHRPQDDLSPIAVERGGGGHPGACGFECDMHYLMDILKRSTPLKAP